MKWDSTKLAILEDGFMYRDLNELALELGCTVKAVMRKAEKLKLHRATNNQVIDGYKFCSFCQKEEPISVFYRNKSASHGFEYYCKKYYEQKSFNKIKSTPTPIAEECYQKRGNPTDTGQKITHRPTNPIVIRNGIEGKICNGCKTWKPLDEYGRDSKGIASRRARCRDCYRKSNKKQSRE